MTNHLRQNITALFVLKGANALLPLILIPYLVRVLGPAKFGLIAFAQAFIQYFAVLTDYGFNLSATRAVAMCRDDPDRVSALFAAVTVIKLGFLSASALVLAGILAFVPRFSENWPLYAVVYISVFGSVLFPVWLYQGLERMRPITVVTVVARVIVLIGVLILVHRPDDYLKAAALQAAGPVLSGAFAMLLIGRVARLRWRWPRVSELRTTLVDGWHVFLSTAAISLYTSSNVFILGLLTNPVAVGYFSAAEKIVKAFQDALGPISQAVYPHIAGIGASSRAAALRFIRKLLCVQGAATFVASALLFLLAGPIVRVVFGTEYRSSVLLVHWMAWLPFIIGLSNVFGIQTMLNFDMKRSFTRIIVASGLFNIAIIIPLTLWKGSEGTAMSILITEISVTVAMAVALSRKGIFRDMAAAGGG
ncbi:MAG TPA: flippase [Rhizobiales bacterium]|nr:flippase [Hyphomicrobiales bacterium]